MDATCTPGAGLLASAWGGEPTTAIALFGLVALEAQQSLVQLFVLLNASSIVFDLLRLTIAKSATAHWLLVIVTVSGTARAEEATYSSSV